MKAFVRYGFLGTQTIPSIFLQRVMTRIAVDRHSLLLSMTIINTSSNLKALIASLLKHVYD